jgi:hypothetical protein
MGNALVNWFTMAIIILFRIEIAMRKRGFHMFAYPFSGQICANKFANTIPATNMTNVPEI